MPVMCSPASTLRVCFSVNKETCDSRVAGAFENCLRDQKIKFAGQPMLSPQSAAEAEDNLKKCVLNNYSMLSMASYRKSADCEKWVPKIKKTQAKADAKAKAKVQRIQETAFEDPLDNQRDLVGRYKLRILYDIRMAENLRDNLKARKTCMNDKNKRESNLNCFKRMIAEFKITSSVQLPLLASVAVVAALKDKEEGLMPSNGQLIDAVLAVAERAQIEQFHLWNLQANNDVDRVALNQLRVDDEKLLKSSDAKMHAVLLEKFNAKSKGREPSSMSDLKMRLDALKARRWKYDH